MADAAISSMDAAPTGAAAPPAPGGAEPGQLGVAELQQQLDAMTSLCSALRARVQQLEEQHVQQQLGRALTCYGDAAAASAGWASGLGLGAELAYQRMCMEAEATAAAVSHRGALQDQRSELSKKAVGLVAGVLGAGSGGQARLGQGSEGAEGGAHQPQRLHVASSSLEVERQVELLITQYLAGDMSEDAAVQQLSQLGCSLRLEAAPAAGPAAGSAGAGEGAGAGAAAEGVCTGAAADAAPEGAPPAPPQQEQQPQQETQPQPVGGSGSAWVPAPAGALDFPVGGFYAQYVLAEPDRLRRLISRATSASAATQPSPGMPAQPAQLSAGSAPVGGSSNGSSSGLERGTHANDAPAQPLQQQRGMGGSVTGVMVDSRAWANGARVGKGGAGSGAGAPLNTASEQQARAGWSSWGSKLLSFGGSSSSGSSWGSGWGAAGSAAGSRAPVPGPNAPPAPQSGPSGGAAAGSARASGAAGEQKENAAPAQAAGAPPAPPAAVARPTGAGAAPARAGLSVAAPNIVASATQGARKARKKGAARALDLTAAAPGARALLRRSLEAEGPEGGAAQEQGGQQQGGLLEELCLDAGATAEGGSCDVWHGPSQALVL